MAANRYKPSEVKTRVVKPARSEVTAERRRWRDIPEPLERAMAMVTTAKRIDKERGAAQAAELLFAKMYCGQNLQSLYEVGVARTTPISSDPWGVGTRPSYNVVASTIDTAAAKIAKNKPRALFLTEGGDYEMRKRAKGLTSYIDGVFYANDAYEHGRRSFVDAGWSGLGAIKVWPDKEAGCIRLERALPFEILFDANEWISGTGRTLYQRTYRHRDELIDAFARGDAKAEKRRAIMDAVGKRPGDVGHQSGDMLETWEGWHLAGADDKGCHEIAIEGCELFNEKWPKAYFPFGFFTLRPGIVGARGIGWAEDLLGIQLEIAKLLRVRQRALHIMTGPKIFCRNASIIKTQWNNDVGTFIETDEPPTIWAGSLDSVAQLDGQIDSLKQAAYELVGVSQLSASAKKPEGLDAAVALREYHDVESERFVLVGQRFEEFFLQIARIVVDMSRDLYADNKKLRVKAPGTKVLEQIDWDKVDLKEDQYALKAFPTSILPTTPAGRLQKVQELYEAGFIGKDQAMSLLDFPDLENVVSLEVSGVESVQRMIGAIIDKGSDGYLPPEAEQPLDLAIKLCQESILKAENDGVSEKRVELLRRWMDAAKDLQGQIAGANQPTASAPAAQATANGAEAAAAAPAPAPGMGVPEAMPPPASIGAAMPTPAVASDLPV